MIPRKRSRLFLICLSLVLLITVYLTFNPQLFKTLAFGVWVLVRERDIIDSFEAEKRWGFIKFSPEVFRNGDSRIRAPMAASAIRSNIFVGSSEQELLDSLGEPDGDYFDDGCFNYRLSQNSEGADHWDLVFCFKYPEKIVRKVFVYRSCCNNPPRWVTSP